VCSRWREGLRRGRDRVLAWDLGRVTIIVVSYDSLGLLRQCLESILADASYPSYRVLVVDNASDEPVREYLRRVSATERRVRVIFNENQRGICRRNNIGLRHLGDSEYIVLMNNDTVVPPGWLGQLLRHRAGAGGRDGRSRDQRGVNEARIDVGTSTSRRCPLRQANARA